jgi:hypothetical protein
MRSQYPRRRSPQRHEIRNVEDGLKMGLRAIFSLPFFFRIWIRQQFHHGAENALPPSPNNPGHLATQETIEPSSATRILHPTSTIIGLAHAVTTTNTSSCNVQASIPQSLQEKHFQGPYSEFTPTSCLYLCLVTTPCHSWSWKFPLLH